MTTINDLFQRPAHYWLRRAQRQKQSGDLIRAAVLERHAVRAEPESDAARMSYACTLRDLHCYEASNREAFAALARNPDDKSMYGLIGQNMFSMGMRQTGLDAMSLYAADPPAIPPAWQDEAYDMADANDYPFVRAKRRARLKGLLVIAMRHMAREDMEGAARALRRAMNRPFTAPNARREMALAACFQRLGDRVLCMQHLQAALSLKPNDLHLRLSAVTLYRAVGANAQARKLLVSAVRSARTPLDELLTLTVCDEMKMPQLALYMLRRSAARHGDRFPVNYNQCVCLLRLGRLQEAMQHIHLCREIDPDDAEGEILFARVNALCESDASPKAVRRAAHGFGWYGAMTQLEMAALTEPLWPLIQQGPQSVAQAMSEDAGIRRRLLMLLTLPAEWPAMLLASLQPVLPRPEMTALCREVLLQHPASTPGKQYAAAILHKCGEEPPYATWADDRIALMDPTRAAEGTPAFKQRVLTLRIRQARRLAPRAIIPWAMQLISRMDAGQRRQLLRDPLRVWPLAMAVRFRALNGLKPLHIRLYAMPRMRMEAFRQALHTIHHLERRNQPHEDH